MTKEQIDKAVDEYIGYPREMDEGIETTMRRNAFKDGADWRINSVWHKPEEVPEVGRQILVDKIVGFELYILVKSIFFHWKEIAQYNYVVRWAYIDDLIPTEDERDS